MAHMSSMSPIRVLYATHEPNLTGASRSLLDLLSALDRDKVEPTVLLRSHGPLECKLDEIGVKYVIIPYALAVRGPQSKYPNWVMEAANSIAEKRVVRLLCDGCFDLVHSNSLLADIGMRAARRAELPYVCHVRELVTEDHGLVFCDEFRTKDLMSHAAVNVFISRFVANKFSSWVDNAPKRIMNDAVELDGVAGRIEPPFSSPNVIKAFLPGRFALGKGQLDAIKATKIAHDAGVPIELTLAGGVANQGYHDECVRYVADNRMDYVRIKPFFEDVAAEYGKSDIVLMCSNAEAMGRVTVEGLLAGCLVIGADAGATPEIIRDGENGLLYKCGSPENLADRIVFAANNPGTAQSIASNALRNSNNFSSETYAAGIQALYETIVA